MASDNFADVNATALATHDANWGNVTATLVVAGFKISGNQCVPVNQYSQSGARRTDSVADVSQVDYYAGADATATTTLNLRSSGTAVGYAFQLVHTGTNWTGCTLVRNGTYLGGLALATPKSMASALTMKAWITGSGASTVLHFSVDGEECSTTITDTTPIAAGTYNPGFSATGGGGAGKTFDNWTDGSQSITFKPIFARKQTQIIGAAL